MGVAWRFATLRVQSYWVDEAYTVELVHMRFVDMLREIQTLESTPPLYYVLAWAWAKVTGTDEFGLRSLSAAFGAATVVVGYVIGRRMGGRSVGVIGAALIAVNPLLVWYSQEARGYALLSLLTGVSLLYALRATDRQRLRDFVLWAVAAGLALLTHYFAVFFIAAEVVWIIVRTRGARLALATSGLVAVVAAALLPLALRQRDAVYSFSDESVVKRAAQVPKQFIVGFDAPRENTLAAISLLLILVALAGVVRLWKVGEIRQDALGLVAAAATSSVVIPFVLAVVGQDYFSTRNMIGALAPILIIAGLGFAMSRITLFAAAAFAIISAMVNVAVAQDSNYQRTDFRGAIRTLPTPGGPRAFVVATSYRPIRVYAPNTRLLIGPTRAREIAFLKVRSERLTRFRAPPGFRLIHSKRVQQLEIKLFSSMRGSVVTRDSLSKRVSGRELIYVLVQATSRR